VPKVVIHVEQARAPSLLESLLSTGYAAELRPCTDHDHDVSIHVADVLRPEKIRALAEEHRPHVLGFDVVSEAW
jgi:hypothetical protein